MRATWIDINTYFTQICVMQIRVGIPQSFRRFTSVAKELGAPVLISANSMRTKRDTFREIDHDLFNGCDTALDSSGFVAWLRYGGYRWSTAEYVTLVKSYPWAWWSAMDYCCEPEIADDRESVTRRVRDTVRHLKLCQEEADRQGVKPPTPVIQGWNPSDYIQCLDWMWTLPLPTLLGVGSVCRRQLGGPEGLLAIVSRLDRELPPDKVLHLFGAKGTAIKELAGHPRIHSIDSMAWDAAARKEKADGQSCTVEYRSGYLRRWYKKNRDRLYQQQLRMAV